MEENKDKIAISCGDILTLTQAMSSQEVKYARLEMRHEMVLEENERLKRRLEESESARMKAEEENRLLKTQNELLQQDIDTLKTKIANLVSTMQQPDMDMMQQAIEFLLQKHILISILQLQSFMQANVSDLNTALALRGFVMECVPEQLQAATLAVINKVMVLPEKPKPQPPVNYDNRTITMTGNDATYNENPKE